MPSDPREPSSTRPASLDRVLGPIGERGLTALATRRPVGVTMVVLAVVVFGLISFRRLPRSLMPDISYPSITVRTEYPGAAPVDVEERVSRRLEEVLSQVRDLERVTSVSRAEVSDVILEFAWGTNMSMAATDVREKIAQAILPDEVVRPTILRYDPTLDPILQVGIFQRAEDSRSREEVLIELRLLAEELVERELETVPGVAGVRVRGGLEREVRLEVDEQLLRAKGVSIELINRRMEEENLNLASGIIYEGDHARVVRTVNEFADLEEIRTIILEYQEGVPVFLRDVATVSWSFAEPDVITRIDGRPCVKAEVYKEADANVVEVAARVRNAVFGTDEERQRLEKIIAGEREQAARIRSEAELAKTAGEKKSRQPAESSAGGGGGASGAGPPARPRFLASRLPAGMEIALMADQSVFVEDSLADVRQAVITGGILAVVVLYAFLRNAVFTLAIGVSIPLSVIAAFIAMYILDVSLNMMSLGGLALGIGMLVDNSIVVLESIFRCREEGDEPRAAAVRGTRLVSSAVVASTLTTVAVFFPIVFVEGVAGQVFRDQALAVVISLVASLVVALYFIPVLVSRRLARTRAGRSWAGPRILALRWRRRVWPEVRAAVARARARSRQVLPVAVLLVWHLPALACRAVVRWLELLALGLAVGLLALWRRASRRARPLARIGGGLLGAIERFLDAIGGRYERTLGWALGHRGAVLVGVTAAAIFSARLFPRLETELLPEVHQGEFTVEVRLPRATRLEKTDQVVRPWEEVLLSKERLPEIASLTATLGVAKDDVLAGDDGEHTAKFLVELERSGSPLELEERVKRKIRELLRDAEFESVEFRNPVLFTFKAPIEVEVKGQDLDRLEEVVSAIELRMEALDEIKDVRSNLARGSPEVQVRLDRDLLSRYGLKLQEVGDVLRRKLLGEVRTYFTTGDRKVPIRARLSEPCRDSLAELDELVINPGAATEYRLRDVRVRSDAPAGATGSAVGVLPIGDGPAEIRRIGHQRAAVVTANLSGMSLGRATERVGEILKSVERPADFTAGFGGQKEEMERSTRSLERALRLAVFLVFAIMAMQFESLIQPLIIIAAIPLALVGVVPVLWLFEIPLSIVVFIGMIILVGIVVNNAIVLMDAANQLRRAGLPLDDAIMAAGKLRLRPILMTTATTVLGLLPLTGLLSGVPGLHAVFGTGEGVEMRAPLAATVMAGLIASTVLTLLVVPVLASLVGSVTARGAAVQDPPPDDRSGEGT